MNSPLRMLPKQAGFKIILGFVVRAVERVIERHVEIDAVADGARETEIEDGVPGGDNGRVGIIQTIVADSPHAE